MSSASRVLHCLNEDDGRLSVYTRDGQVLYDTVAQKMDEDDMTSNTLSAETIVCGRMLCEEIENW